MDVWDGIASEHAYFSAGAEVQHSNSLTSYRMKQADGTGLEVALVQQASVPFGADLLDELLQFPRVLFKKNQSLADCFRTNGYRVGDRNLYASKICEKTPESDIQLNLADGDEASLTTLFDPEEPAPDGFHYASGQFSLLMLEKCKARHFDYYTASHEELLVGAIGIVHVDHDIYRLKNLYVRPELRGLRYGSRIISAALSEIRSRAGKMAIAYALEGNRSNTMYQSMKFDLVGSDQQASRIERLR